MPLPAAEDVAGFSFTFTTQQGVDFTSAVIRVELHAAIEARLRDESRSLVPVGEIRTETYFQLSGIEALTTQQPDGSQALPEMVGATALGLAFSTSRGLLLALSADSLLRQAYLPVINPLQLLRSGQPTPPAAQ